MSQGKKSRSSAFYHTRLLCIVSVAMVLLVLEGIGLVEIAGRQLKRQVQEDISLTILLAPEMSAADGQALSQSIAKEPFVESVLYISADEAAKALASELGEDPVEALGYNPLRPEISIHIKSTWAHPDSLTKVDNKIRAWKGVDNLSYRADIFQAVDKNMRTFRIGLFVVAIILLIISFIQINNTTRLTIYARRFQIRTMSLVGATPSFIRRPIVLQSMLDGFIGGIIAVILMASGIMLVRHYKMSDLLVFLPLSEIAVLSGIIILLGIMVSATTSFFSSHKYIRMNGGKMHLI